MDRYEAMRVFVRVAELQSFSQAADTLGLPKATVSTSVQDLEALIGVRLLHRTTRQVHLTPDGTSFLERCKDLLQDLEETESMFKGDTAQVTGKIRVDMTVSLARDFLIPQLSKFLEKYPGLEVELSGTDRRVDLIREGIDCVVRGGGRAEPGLIEKELGRMPVLNVVSPHYLEKHGRPKNLEDLKNHKLIQYSQVLGTKPGGFEYFDGEKYRELKMTGVITVNNVDTYKAACLAGLGICQNPLPGIAKDLKNGKLVEVLPKFRAEPMTLKLVYQQRRALSKRVRVFMDWLEPMLKEYLERGG
jgi:DNA-binding transcriptional LysR family regulator